MPWALTGGLKGLVDQGEDRGAVHHPQDIGHVRAAGHSHPGLSGAQILQFQAEVPADPLGRHPFFEGRQKGFVRLGHGLPQMQFSVAVFGKNFAHYNGCGLNVMAAIGHPSGMKSPYPPFSKGVLKSP